MPEMRERLSGFALCCALTLVASFLSQGAVGAQLGTAVLAMAIGIALAQVLPVHRVEAGADWVVKTLLPLGIILLGARVDVGDLAGLGLRGVAMGVCVIALSAGFFFCVRRFAGLSPRLAVLLAMGNGICGGSAIAAAAPVVGARRDEIAASVSAVVVAGTVGTLALPLLGSALELDPKQFGLWAGLSLQQTPQVVAAGLAQGADAGAVATAAKLVRISLLVPVIFLLGFFRNGKSCCVPEGGFRKLVPGFLWGFLAVSAASTLSLLPEIKGSIVSAAWSAGIAGSVSLRELAVSGSEICMVLAMAAIGLQTRWQSLREVGPRAMAAALLGALVVSGAVFGAVVGGIV